MADFLLDGRDPGDAGNQQADRNRRNRHHHGIGQEIEEIQKLHAQKRDVGQRAVAQRGEAAQRNHHRAHQHRRSFAAPAQLILKGGDGAFRQRDGAGHGREEHQHEEQDADRRAQPHAVKHLRDGDEHQRGAGLQGGRFAAGEREDGGNNHQTGHHGNRGIENLHRFRRAFDGNVFFHIRAEGNQNAHRDGKRIEHLPHGGHDRHPREVFKIRHEEIFDARQRARPRDGIPRDQHGEHDEHRHHQPGDALNAVAHARVDDKQRRQREDDEAQLGGQAVGDERAEIAVGRQRVAVAEQVFHQILDDPAADDRVIRHNENRDDGVEPAARRQPARFAEGLKRADGAFAGHAADGGFRDDHGIAEGQRQQDVDQQEDAAAVLGRQIGEAPDVAKAHGGPGRGEHEPDLAGKRAAGMRMLLHACQTVHSFFM